MSSFIDRILDSTSSPQKAVDFYEVLGCDETANEEQIQAEYKQRALELHPDKNQDSETLEQFQLLQEAKEILLDKEMRAKYDKWKKSGLSIPFKQYANIKTTSLHWVTKASKELSVTDGSVVSLSKKEDMEYTRRQTLTGGESSLDSWRAQGAASADQLLKKFRNYEI